jgi:hypothetical protein
MEIHAFGCEATSCTRIKSSQHEVLLPVEYNAVLHAQRSFEPAGRRSTGGAFYSVSLSLPQKKPDD